MGQKGDVTGGLGEAVGVHEGLTLGISVISMGDTAEPLLPCGVPDLGRDGQMVRRSQGAETALAEGTHAVIWEMCGKVRYFFL